MPTPNNYALLFLAAPVLLGSGSSQAATALLDFGPTPTTPPAGVLSVVSYMSSGTTYNQVGGTQINVGSSLTSTAFSDTAGAALVWTLTLGNTSTGISNTGNVGAAAYETTFPAALSGTYATSALQDSLFVNAQANQVAEFTVTINNLTVDQSYDLLMYGSRRNAQNRFQTWTLIAGSGTALPVSHDSLANTGTLVDWDAIQPDSSGRIAFTISSNAAAAGANALNFIEIKEVPEVSSAVLGGLAGLMLLARRRRS